MFFFHARSSLQQFNLPFINYHGYFIAGIPRLVTEFVVFDTLCLIMSIHINRRRQNHGPGLASYWTIGWSARFLNCTYLLLCYF